MSLAAVGINHKTAPLAVRERVAIGRDALSEVTRALAQWPGVHECLIVSTCNRVEVLAEVESPSVDVAEFLLDRFGIERSQLEPHLYRERDCGAIRHLFRVAASLDSMVVGEAQILGQVKESYSVAREAGTVGPQLEHLLQSAFAVAKKVRTETAIGANSVSIASVAVELAQQIFGSLAGKTVFLVGAGRMSELAARHLVSQGAGTILVANRTRERAERLAAAFHGRVVGFEDLHTAASEADIVITSTGSPQAIFRKEHGAVFLHKRRNRPMFFIDIAVPRDVDPAMNALEGIFVYDVDDLQQVASAHLARRSQEASEAEAVIEREVERFRERQRVLNAVPALVALQQNSEEIRHGELQRACSRLRGLSEKQWAAVEAITRGVVNKLLHPQLVAIKKAARESDWERFEALREAWSLPPVDAQPCAEQEREPSEERNGEDSE